MPNAAGTGKKKRRNARKDKLEALRKEEEFLVRENDIMKRTIEWVDNLVDVDANANGSNSEKREVKS